VLPGGDGEIGEQRPRLARWRQVKRLAVAHHLKIAKHAQLQHVLSAVHASTRLSIVMIPLRAWPALRRAANSKIG